MQQVAKFLLCAPDDFGLQQSATLPGQTRILAALCVLILQATPTEKGSKIAVQVHLKFSTPNTCRGYPVPDAKIQVKALPYVLFIFIQGLTFCHLLKCR